MSQYYGPIARARGNQERARRKKARQAQRERDRKAWLASPAGQEHLARKARRLERQKTCCVCRAPTPAERIQVVDGVRTTVPAGCCSWECAAVHWLYLDELEQARGAGVPVALWRRGPGAQEHARYLKLKAERCAIANRRTSPEGPTS